MTGDKRTAAFVAIAGVAIGLFAQNAIPVGVFHDDGQYLILARSLAEHATYRFDNLPGAPPGVHYPPGYPAFLALVWWIAPGNFYAFKIANAVLMGAAALAVFVFARRIFALGARPAAATAVAVVASTPFLWLNSLLVSETLFVALLCATLALDAARKGATARWHVALGAIAGATALVRSLADPLGPLIALARAARGRRREAAIVAASWLTVVLPWKLWLRAHAHDMPAPLTGAYGEYAAWWRTAFDAHGWSFVTATLRSNLAQLPLMVTLFGWDMIVPLRWVAAATFALVAAAGAWRVRREAAVAFAFSLAYSAVVLIWPFEPGRFLWMLAPVAVAAFAAGAPVVYAMLPARRNARVSVAALAALVLAIGLLQTHVSAYRDPQWEHGLGDRGRKGEAAARLAAALPPGARIASDFDEIVHLQTGRVLVPALGLTAEEYVFPQSDSTVAARLGTTLTAFGITHVIVADVPTLKAVQWLDAHGVAFLAVASDSGGAVVFARTGSARPTSPTRQ